MRWLYIRMKLLHTRIWVHMGRIKMLTKSDYGEIEVAVRKMLNTSSSQPQLQTSLGHIVSVTGTPDQTVTRWDQIRAGYAPGSNRITLPGLLLGPADNSPQCRAHLIACVAHELRHNFQDIGEQRGGGDSTSSRSQ